MTRYLVASAVLTIACGGAGLSGPPSTVQMAVPSVVVLDSGTDPREVLRYRLADRTSAEGAFVLRVVPTRPDEQGPASNPMPALKAALDAGPIERDATGTHYSLAVGEIEVADTEGAAVGAAELTSAIACELQGRTVRMTRDDRGLALGQSEGWGDVGAKGAFEGGLLTILGTLRGLLHGIPLPEAPVGGGATWEVQRSVRIAGVELRELSRYIVTSTVGSQMRVSIGVQQTAMPQRLETSGQRAIELKSHIARAEGYAILDLEAPIPTEIYVEIEGRTLFEGTNGNTEAPVTERQLATFRMFMGTPRVSAAR